MTRTISVSEAKNTLSAVLEWAVENDDGIVIQSRGEPKAVIVPYEKYAGYLALEEQARRQAALRELKQLAEEIWARNADLTDPEVDQLAEEITQETFQRMLDEGKIQFES